MAVLRRRRKTNGEERAERTINCWIGGGGGFREGNGRRKWHSNDDFNNAYTRDKNKKISPKPSIAAPLKKNLRSSLPCLSYNLLLTRDLLGGGGVRRPHFFRGAISPKRRAADVPNFQYLSQTNHSLLWPS